MTAEAAFSRLTELAEESDDNILELEDNASAEESAEVGCDLSPLLPCHGLANSSSISCFESDIE